MPPAGILVDSNLLVLLVVGSFDTGLIERHPRLSAYDESNEITVMSSRAAHRAEFGRLGLADSVLLEAIHQDFPLVTVDLQLYLAASAEIGDSAINFTYRLNH